MAEKKIELELRFPLQEAPLFRTFVENLNYDDEGNSVDPYGAEIIYEEEYDAGQLHGQKWEAGVEFSLWFDRPRTAYWFARRLAEAQAAWTQLLQEGGQKGA